MTALKNYEVTEARFIAGQHRKVGDPVQMAERAAKYYVAPYGTGLKVAGADVEAQATADAEAQAAAELEAKAAADTEGATGKKRK